MIANFTHWEEAVETRDEILKLRDVSLVKGKITQAYERIINGGSSKQEQLDFLNHLNSLFLNILINNIIPKDISLNPEAKANYLEIVEKAREQLKELILKYTP